MNLIFVITYLVRNTLSGITNHFFWLFKLAHIKTGKSVHIDFPIAVTGKGQFILGDEMKIQSHVVLGAGKNSVVSFGTGTIIQRNFLLKVSDNVKLTFGDHCKLGNGTVAFTNADWQIGNNVTIASNCAIYAREPGKNGELYIQHNSHIGDNTIIDLTDTIEIGEDVAIGPNCTLYTHDHDYRKSINEAAWRGPLIKDQINIADGAWIGSNVTILPGVTIGINAVVASGSVVTKSVEARTTVAGVPAKVIGSL